MAKPIIKSHKNQTIFAVSVIVLFALFSIFLAYSVYKTNLGQSSYAKEMSCRRQCKEKCDKKHESHTDSWDACVDTCYNKKCTGNGGAPTCAEQCITRDCAGKTGSALESCAAGCHTCCNNPNAPGCSQNPPPQDPPPQNPPPANQSSATQPNVQLPQCPYTVDTRCPSNPCKYGCTADGCASGTFRCKEAPPPPELPVCEYSSKRECSLNCDDTCSNAGCKVGTYKCY